VWEEAAGGGGRRQEAVVNHGVHSESTDGPKGG
jgi:hypothetical protein